jgi:hypothetical protein
MFQFSSNAVGVLAGQSLVTLERSTSKVTTWEVEQERLFLVMLSVVYMIPI